MHLFSCIYHVAKKYLELHLIAHHFSLQIVLYILIVPVLFIEIEVVEHSFLFFLEKSWKIIELRVFHNMFLKYADLFGWLKWRVAHISLNICSINVRSNKLIFLNKKILFFRFLRWVFRVNYRRIMVNFLFHIFIKGFIAKIWKICIEVNVIMIKSINV